jgi:hypothetical protein
VELVHRAFTDFGSQCNFGLSQIYSRWVLSLDADYQLSDDIIREMQALSPGGDTVGYRANFVYRVYGYLRRSTLYPPRVVLYQKDLATYRNEGHGHRVVVSGNVLPLVSAIYHDDRKPLARWFQSQQRYAREEALHLLKADSSTLSFTDRLRLIAWPAPLAIFVYTLIGKGCLR